ncbi:hypothetical protein [Caldinitratiruptor microaerophilus]|uniref:Uncharacterized protein n=1 Tax=Caldinitratiruptor microaerophilus TaxID=671077 RepID=A0AA35G6Z2_9FIRM|nr:hypothetical protein [Caldinitratiruptor microaerophilus]BDG59511.1 hypothetical protein caldi_06010 [Caldinitratiruptor microaerophilus]
MARQDGIEQIFKDIYQTLGYTPTNNSIKPVHIVNGLCRACLGGYYDTRPLNRTAVWWVRKQKAGFDEERNPSNALLEEYSTLWPNVATSQQQARFEDFRRLLKATYGADGAVYEQGDQSSFTLANERAVTGDRSHNGVGRFLYRLLTAGRGAAGSPTVAWLLEVLQDNTDPWSTLAWPLLERSQWRPDSTSEEAVESLDSPIMRGLRAAFDRLAQFERRRRSKLSGLRRLGLLSSFATFLHLITRWVETAKSDEQAARPPILFDVSEGTLRSVAIASHASFRAAGQAVEQFLRYRVKVAFESEGSLPTSDDDARAFLTQLAGEEKNRERLLQRFIALRQSEGYSVADAVVRSVVDQGLESRTGSPMGFLKELGRRAGFVGPWGNRSERKRYQVTSDFLEVLVIATVDQGEPVEFPALLDQWRSQFGVVVGQEKDDDVIRRNNLLPYVFGLPTPVDEDELRQNVKLLKRHLEDIGYAHTYADGTTIVLVE